MLLSTNDVAASHWTQEPLNHRQPQNDVSKLSKWLALDPEDEPTGSQFVQVQHRNRLITNDIYSTVQNLNSVSDEQQYIPSTDATITGQHRQQWNINANPFRPSSFQQATNNVTTNIQQHDLCPPHIRPTSLLLDTTVGNSGPMTVNNSASLEFFGNLAIEKRQQFENGFLAFNQQQHLIQQNVSFGIHNGLANGTANSAPMQQMLHHPPPGLPNKSIQQQQFPGQMVGGNVSNHLHQPYLPQPLDFVMKNGGNSVVQDSGKDDIVWQDPDAELRRWQQYTGTAVWGTPEKNPEPIQRWTGFPDKECIEMTERLQTFFPLLKDEFNGWGDLPPISGGIYARLQQYRHPDDGSNEQTPVASHPTQRGFVSDGRVPQAGYSQAPVSRGNRNVGTGQATRVGSHHHSVIPSAPLKWSSIPNAASGQFSVGGPHPPHLSAILNGNNSVSSCSNSNASNAFFSNASGMINNGVYQPHNQNDVFNAGCYSPTFNAMPPNKQIW